jgi:iron complex outermembrane recepter protein
MDMRKFINAARQGAHVFEDRRPLRRALLCGAATLCAGAMISSPSHAQRAASASAQTQLSEVVVTAERRETNLQDTPVSVVALDAEEMTRAGATRLDDVRVLVPNLAITYDTTLGRSTPRFSIRGVGAGVVTSGAVNEQPVALYIDGLYFPRSQGSLVSLADAAQLQVLRGPQGTLFGRNTTGGAVVYTSQMPTDQFEGSVSLALGEFAQREVRAMLNVPISDGVYLRAMAANLKQDGYVRRGPVDLGDVDEQVYRVQLRLQPTANLTVDLSATHSETRNNGGPFVLTGISLFGTTPGAQVQAMNVLLLNDRQPALRENDPRFVIDDFTAPSLCIIDDIDPDTFGAGCSTDLEGSQSVFSARAEWNLSESLSLTSITGSMSGEQRADHVFMFFGTQTRPWGMDWETFSQEVQMNWDTDKFKLVAGGIYYKETSVEDEITRHKQSGGGAFGLSNAQLISGAITVRRNEVYTSEVTSIGLFSQGTWSATDRLDLTAGIRYSDDTKKVSIDYIPTVNDPRKVFSSAEESWSDVDWKVAAAFDVTDDLMIYASVTEAYKAGIANDAALENTNNVSLEIPFIEPEHALGYEVGFRSEWFDRRLRANFTVFQTEYSNRQSRVLRLNPATNVQFWEAISLGDVTYKGVEGEMSWLVTSDLTVSGSYGYTDYEVADNPANRLPEVPHNSFALGLVWTPQLFSSGDLEVSLNYGYVGDAYSRDAPPTYNPVTNPEQTLRKGYGLLSGRATYKPHDAGWSLSVYGTNLTDEVYAVNDIRDTFLIGGDAGVGRSLAGEWRGRPRSLGAEVRFDF